jgi:hypothetical protein
MHKPAVDQAGLAVMAACNGTIDEEVPPLLDSETESLYECQMLMNPLRGWQLTQQH